MVHYHEINDRNGDLIELVPFCSDSCHVEWCRRHNVEYGGWNGAHEGADYNEFCANCGTIASIGIEESESCECQRDNVVVNRFLSDTGEKCEHGNWIQIPYRMMEDYREYDETGNIPSEDCETPASDYFKGIPEI